MSTAEDRLRAAEAALTRVRALLPLWDQDRPCERPDCPNRFHVAATALRAALATPEPAAPEPKEDP